jgi:hypothetical protein
MTPFIHVQEVCLRRYQDSSYPRITLIQRTGWEHSLFRFTGVKRGWRDRNILVVFRTRETRRDAAEYTKSVELGNFGYE